MKNYSKCRFNFRVHKKNYSECRFNCVRPVDIQFIAADLVILVTFVMFRSCSLND